MSIPGHTAITPAHIERLGDAVERYNADLPPLKEFILPGGTRRGGARARRANRLPARRARGRGAGSRMTPVSQPSRVYLNRLSDLLFVLARALNRAGDAPDVLWQKGRARGEPGR